MDISFSADGSKHSEVSARTSLADLKLERFTRSKFGITTNEHCHLVISPKTGEAEEQFARLLQSHEIFYSETANPNAPKTLMVMGSAKHMANTLDLLRKENLVDADNAQSLSQSILNHWVEKEQTSFVARVAPRTTECDHGFSR